MSIANPYLARIHPAPAALGALMAMLFAATAVLALVLQLGLMAWMVLSLQARLIQGTEMLLGVDAVLLGLAWLFLRFRPLETAEHEAVALLATRDRALATALAAWQVQDTPMLYKDFLAILRLRSRASEDTSTLPTP